MIRHRVALRPYFGALAVASAIAGPASAQQAAPPAAAYSAQQPLQVAPQDRPEVIMIRALRSNPLTAPYGINATWQDGAVILWGRVGTKRVHDAAVQMAIAFGFPFRDRLVIDTAETFRSAMSATPSMTGYGALAPNLSSSYYVYPQPLFSWLDDPFFGMQPPVVTFAPWWRGRREGLMTGPGAVGPGAGNFAAAPNGGNAPAAANQVPMNVGMPAGGGFGAAGPAPGMAGSAPGMAGPAPGMAGPGANGNPWGGNAMAPGLPPGVAPGGAMELPPPKGDIELTVDSAGTVILRGVVTSEEAAREIEQTARSVPGVSRVFSQLVVRDPNAKAPNAPSPVNAPRDEPPPQPVPVPVPPGGPFMVQPRRDPGAAPVQIDRPADSAPPAPAPPTPPDRAAEPARPAPGGDAPAAADTAPRPPQLPANDETPAPQAGPARLTIAALDGQRLTRRVADSLQKRPALAGNAIEVRSTADAVMLSGKVPSAYEAMLAYRAAQQTPGVHEVLDRLEFLVPDEDHPNPLVRKGRPDDIEPYLSAQMSRHLGELAHIDSVRARGNHLEIRGTLLDAGDRERVLAILRSIPVLHGFKLDSTFTTD